MTEQEQKPTEQTEKISTISTSPSTISSSTKDKINVEMEKPETQLAKTPIEKLSPSKNYSSSSK